MIKNDSKKSGTNLVEPVGRPPPLVAEVPGTTFRLLTGVLKPAEPLGIRERGAGIAEVPVPVPALRF